MYKDKIDLDYHKYDIVSCDIKKKDVDEIIDIYISLGYKIYHNENSELYLDSKHLIFYRDHNIKNKDKLQYLQVDIEMMINNTSVKNQNKYISLILISTLFVILGLGFIAGGVTILNLLTGKMYLTLAIICFIFSFFEFIFTTIFILKRKKNIDKNFDEYKKKINLSIQKDITYALELLR